MNQTEAPPFEHQMRRIEQLIRQIENTSDSVVQDAAREMVRALLQLHAAGLARMRELLCRAGDGAAVLNAWGSDELVRNLLLLHDLHPEETATRVERALEGVRPYLKSHGGGVELLEASADLVRLRMQGNCQGCPSSAATMKSLIENAIYDAAPEVAEICLEEDASHAAASGLVQLQLSAAAAGNDDRRPERH